MRASAAAVKNETFGGTLLDDDDDLVWLSFLLLI
jgi:hypothetical protein